MATTAQIRTDEYAVSHGHRPRGRGNWAFDLRGRISADACRRATGLAHDDAMALENACAFCGASRTWISNETYSAAIARLRAPGQTAPEWNACP